MKWFIDTEFDEDGRTIELISIALVSERLEDAVLSSGVLLEVGWLEYYAVSTEFDPDHCNDWVKLNVLPKLPPRDAVRRAHHLKSGSMPIWRSRAQIRSDILEITSFDYGIATPPEFWGYYADYDWVVLCQLFGRMVDLPQGWPMYCNDIKQVMHEHDITRETLSLPEPANAHDALCDARHQRDMYNACMLYNTGMRMSAARRTQRNS